MKTVLCKYLSRAVCLFSLLLMLQVILSPSAQALGETGSIRLVKKWSGDGDKPDSVSFSLINGGQKLQSIVLSADDAAADGSWQGSFENVPLYDGRGNLIQYSVTEQALEGWEAVTEQLPSAETLRVKSFGEKVTPASESSYSIGLSNMLVANKGGNYYIWTREGLSASQQERLMSGINAAKLQGFGKELKSGNTQFQSGLPAEFQGGVSLREARGLVYVDFQRTNVWSLFYSGIIELTEARSAIILNRPSASSPTPAPSPTTAPSPGPSPSPSPTLPPSASPSPSSPPTSYPETGDSGSGGAAAALILSLAAAGFILWKLKKDKNRP